jgi:hypothetical protein
MGGAVRDFFSGAMPVSTNYSSLNDVTVHPRHCGQFVSRINSTLSLANRKQSEGMEILEKSLVAAIFKKAKDLRFLPGW